MAIKKRVNRAKNAWISTKIQKIMHEGVRRNTRMPYSAKNNPRRPVTLSVAKATAESMYLRRNK